MRFLACISPRSLASTALESTALDLADLVETPETGPKDGINFVPAVFEKCPQPCDSSAKKCDGTKYHRRADRVRALTAFVLDVDSGTFSDLVGRLLQIQAEGISFAWWTTHSWSGDLKKIRARVVIPFASPLEIKSPAEWSRHYWQALVERFGFQLSSDPSCRDASRLYYTPRVRENGAPYKSGLFSGTLFDPQTLPKPVSSVQAVTPVITPTKKPESAEPVNLDEYVETMARSENAFARALAKGDSLTPPPHARQPGQPSRYEAWRSATAYVATLAKEEHSSEALCELFRASHAKEASESPNDFTPWERIENLFAQAREKAPAYKAQREAEEKAHREALLKALTKANDVAPQPKQTQTQAQTQKEDEEDWRGLLSVNPKTLAPIATPANLMLILTRAPEFKDSLMSDAVNGRLFVKPFSAWTGEADGAPFRPICDADAVALTVYLELKYGLRFTSRACEEMLMTVCLRNKRDLLAEELLKLEWDGVDRLSNFFARYFGAVGAFAEKISALWPVACVARATRPGSKVDTVLVLEGPQGRKKSTALSVLGGDWYTDQALDLNSKDTLGIISESWLVELGELESIRRSGEVTAFKQFASKQYDDFRPPYGRHKVRHPRRCVFVGTTNQDEYLSDETGNRRIWPVKVGEIDVEALKRDRVQIWAQAVHLLNSGAEWWLPADDVLQLAEAQSRVGETSIAEAVIEMVCATEPKHRPTSVTTSDVINHIKGKVGDRALEIRIGRELKIMGFERRRMRRHGQLIWAYVTPKKYLDSLGEIVSELREPISGAPGAHA